MVTTGIRVRLEQGEDDRLAPYAARSGSSRGRRYPAEGHDYRTIYQQDRDKIVYSAAFRRLQYKTQVFVTFEGDHYRTRLTHTLEATQIGRTIARALGLNEDLVEAITLGHDLGHAPFGHASEDALDDLIQQEAAQGFFPGSGDPGGFEHNRQSLRIVDVIEGHNAHHPGLNLSWEVREGLAKHRFAGPYPELAEFQGTPEPSLEAQVANVADEIAYNCHDVDDGLRAGLVTVEELGQNQLWAQAVALVRAEVSDASPDLVRYRAVKTLINQLVTDVIESTILNLQILGIRSVDDARQAPRPAVAHSTEIAPLANDLKTFLHRNVYYHYQVARMKEKARRLIADVFNSYLAKPEQLPNDEQAKLARAPRPRVICDYIACMTDRYALEEHQRLFNLDVRLLP